MAKGSGSSTGSGGGTSRPGRVSTVGTSSPRSKANSQIWCQPATAKQIAALKANGNFDGKYYSKGRAAQTIGDSVRASQSGPAPRRSSIPPSAPLRPPAPQLPPSLDEVVQPPAGGRASARQPHDGTRSEVAVITHVPVEGSVLAATLVGYGRSPNVTGRGMLSFDLLNDLEARHLQRFESEHSSNWGAELRSESKAWADLKLRIAKMLSSGHEELVDIFGEAPAGAVPDPIAAASDLLASSSPGELEVRHLRAFMSDHSSNWGTELRREIREWVNARIDMAQAEARMYVDLATARVAPTSAVSAVSDASTLTAASTTESTRTSAAVRGRHLGSTLFGTVDRINAHGAEMLLESGERGWLHISKLRVLNDGFRVDDVSRFLEMSQRIRVRTTGTNERGQVVLALVRPEVPRTRSQNRRD